MIELRGLNGTSIFIQAATIAKIRPPYEDESPAVTVVEYTGGYLRTLEDTSALLARLPIPPKMIRVTVPDKSKRYLNALSISQIKQAAPENGNGTELVVGGRYQHVLESVEEVIALVNS